MAFASIHRNLFRRSIIPRPLFSSARSFNTPLAGSESDHEGDDHFDTSTAALSGGPTTRERRTPLFRPLENGLDPGVYKVNY